MTPVLHIGAALLGLAALLLIAQAFAFVIAQTVRDLGVALKPFSCDACLTFWLTLLLLVGIAAMLHNLTMRTATDALVFAFINYFYIKTKITIYE